MALNEYGYQRTTADVDVLLTADGLARFKARVLGRGYVEKFPGSRGARVALLPLPTLIELKLASGMTAPHRLKDLADDLNEFVRPKYLELWQAMQNHPDE